MTQKYRTVVLGNFDGLHKGHQQLIRLGREIADQNGEELAVFTFYPQIQELFDPAFCYLLSEEKKAERLGQLGVDVLQTVPFDAQIARLTPEAFVKTILVEKMHAQHVVVGFNYTFGYQGAGNPEKLQELCSQYGISVTVMEPCCVDDEIVSSSTIRSYLKDGRIEKVNEMLGYVYTVSGVVCQGNQIGRTIGFPTANIMAPPKLLLPANGVYAALTKVDGVTYPGILNIGLRPTIKNSVGINIEVNLFHFDADIYGKEIEIGIRYFLRSEVKFSGLEALKAQLEKDKAQTRQLFQL